MILMGDFFFVGGRFYMYIYTCFNFEHLLVKSMFWLRNHLFVLLNPIFFPILGGLIFAERSPNANDGTIGRTTMAPQRLNPDFSLTMSCLNS